MRPLLFSRHDRVLLHIPPDAPAPRAAMRSIAYRIAVAVAVALAIGALIYAEMTP